MSGSVNAGLEVDPAKQARNLGNRENLRNQRFVKRVLSKDFRARTQGEFSSQILFNQFLSLLHHQVKGSKVTFAIGSDETPALEALSRPGFWEDCFYFTLDLDTGHGSLDLVNSLGSRCPLPAQNRGNYLLSLTEALAKSFNLSKIHIQDLSQIACPRNKEGVSLALLGIFQTGKSWYGRHGYEPEKNKEKYWAAVESLKALSLDEVSEGLMALQSFYFFRRSQSQFGNYSSWDSFIDKPVEVYSLFQEEILRFKVTFPSNRLDDFMSWEWEGNCENYVLFANALTYTRSYPHYLDAPWTDALQTILQLGESLEKRFP